jgi:hypothetical protein
VNTPGLVFVTVASLPVLSVIIEVDPKLNVLVLVILLPDPLKVIAHGELAVPPVPALKMPELVIDAGEPDIVIVDPELVVNVPELSIKVFDPDKMKEEPWSVKVPVFVILVPLPLPFILKVDDVELTIPLLESVHFFSKLIELPDKKLSVPLLVNDEKVLGVPKLINAELFTVLPLAMVTF